MQTKKLDKNSQPECLAQGHIFRLEKVQFNCRDSVNGKLVETVKSFKDFYPFAEFTSLEWGIIITQSCDLENRKTPYITVGVLEKFDNSLAGLLNAGFYTKAFRTYEKQTSTMMIY